MRRGLALVTCVSTVTLAIASPRSASAQSPDDQDSRYAYVLNHFEKDESKEAWWWNGWTVFYTVATVGEGVLALAASEEGARVDAIVDCVKSALGLFAMLVLTPRTPITAASRLRAMDARTPEARRLRLRTAETLLEETADGALFGTGWLAQIASGAVNLAGAYVQWVGYDRRTTGWIGLVLGVGVSEAQILTRPTGSVRALNEYSNIASRRAGLSVRPGPGGFAINYTF